MNNPQYIFHIGMPKTATSFLQKNFYPLLDIEYLGKHYNREGRERFKAFEKEFAKLFGMQSFKNDIEIYEKLKSMMPKEGKILYSNELMSGSSRVNFLNALQISYHLKRAFKNPKIIFVIRRQDSFIESIYRQAIRGGYAGSLKSFINYKRREFQYVEPGKKGWMDIYSLNYYDWVKHYEKLFGKENMLILPYERLRSDRDGYLQDICDFIGVEYKTPQKSEQTNSADSYYLLQLMRLSNACFSKRIQNRINDVLLFDKLVSPINYIKSNKKYLDKDLAKEIMQIHKESNRKLSQEYDLELDKFAYC